MRKPWATVLLACFAVAPAEAATLEEVAAAMGAAKVESLALSGSGMFYGLGQSYEPGMPWPKFNLVRGSRAFDYGKGIFVENFVVTQAENPPRGGSRQPVIGEQQRTRGVTGGQAWTVAGPWALSAPGAVAALQHELWISPHGIVKAALADKVQLTAAANGGGSFTVERARAFHARATVNAAKLVERVESIVNHPVLGDMPVVTIYADYKDVDGVKVPMRITQNAGGFPVLELAVSEAKINAGVPDVPSIRTEPAVVRFEKAADGVWFITGGTHHSIAVEMSDHIVMFEGPLADGRASMVISATRQHVPDKPIRRVVNTHHHFDHSGGLRAFAAEGVTIVTHEVNKRFFELAYAAPRTLHRDRLAASGKIASFETVGEKLVFSDASRTIELHHLKGNSHNGGLIVGYLPNEKILIVADAFSPREPITKTPERLNPFTTNLWANIERLKLDIDTILPIHGRMVKLDELRIEAGVK